MSSRRSLFLVLLIANLLCGQQVALAHMVGHLGDLQHRSVVVSINDHDPEHGSLASLSHACTTCAALAGFDFPFGRNSAGFPCAGDTCILPAAGDIPPLSLVKPLPFQSRAPPSSQD